VGLEVGDGLGCGVGLGTGVDDGVTAGGTLATGAVETVGVAAVQAARAIATVAGRRNPPRERAGGIVFTIRRGADPSVRLAALTRVPAAP
jgi:hypothetical protein